MKAEQEFFKAPSPTGVSCLIHKGSIADTRVPFKKRTVPKRQFGVVGRPRALAESAFLRDVDHTTSHLSQLRNLEQHNSLHIQGCCFGPQGFGQPAS